MTSSEKFAIQSMAMDLKRVALGIYNNSPKMAKRFFNEAKARQNEIHNYPPYIKTIFQKVLKLNSDEPKSAEDALMYSTILQNYSLN